MDSQHGTSKGSSGQATGWDELLQTANRRQQQIQRWARMTDEEKDTARRRLSEGHEKRKAAMTPEDHKRERDRRSEVMVNRWANMPEEKRDQTIAAMSAAQKKRYNDMSPEERNALKAQRSAAQVRRSNEIPPQERKEIKAQRSAKQKARNNAPADPAATAATARLAAGTPQYSWMNPIPSGSSSSTPAGPSRQPTNPRPNSSTRR